MFSHILIPTDGSPLSTVAMEKSMEFARDAQAQVTVLAVVEPFSGFWIAAEHLTAAHAEHQRTLGRAGSAQRHRGGDACACPRSGVPRPPSRG